MSSLRTAGPDPSKAFYRQVFDWRLETVPDVPMGFWRLDGHVGGQTEQPMPRDAVAVLAPIGTGDPTPPHWSVAVSVVDIDATALQPPRSGRGAARAGGHPGVP